MDRTGIKTSNRFTGALGSRKIALIASFFAHLLLVLSLQLYAPNIWPVNELKTYKVELMRDAVEDMSPAKLEEAGRDNSLKKIVETDKNSEETISLDTKDERYISYARVLKKKLATYWGYPRKAKDRLMEGTSHAVFSLSRDGQLTGISITGSSGHKILDQEGADAIKRAAPFPAFPDSITVNKLNIRVSFSYQIKATEKKD